MHIDIARAAYNPSFGHRNAAQAMIPDGTPDVSVVVRSIGRATLERALTSIASDVAARVEIVLVAASGSGHAPLPDRVGRCRIVAVRPDRALPRPEAADAGIRAARGEWITFLDDDDEFLPGHLAGLRASALAGTPGTRAVTGRAVATFLSGRTEAWGQRFALAELYQRNFVHLSTLLFHRSLLDTGIAFDTRLPLHEDWDFALQLAQHTRFADWPHTTFRWHADAGSSGGGGDANADDGAFTRHRDYVYAKWATIREPWLARCTDLMQTAAAQATAGRVVEAGTTANAVLAVSQNDPHALNLLAMLAMRRGDTAEALACESLAVEVRPHDPDLRFNLANVQLASGEAVNARATLAHVLTLAPAHAGAAARLRQLEEATHATTFGGSTPGSYASEANASGAGSGHRAAPEKPSDAALRDELLELERHCANHPDDAQARRRLFQVFIALRTPVDLPGASLALPTDAPAPRVAVVTPYFRESLATLERCHLSVQRQTVRCEHIMIADGFARDELDAWAVRHIRLPTPHGDFGDTPRRIAGEAALDAGFDAVAYLDADNWLRPRHVESLLACGRARGAVVCHSARTLHRPDGSMMPLMQQGDNIEHVDTSCLLITAEAFDLLPIWGTWPRELSRIDDRMFWHAAKARGHARAFSGALTTCYEMSHLGPYWTLGETAPPGTRPNIDLDELAAWHRALTAPERTALDRCFGFSVSDLVAQLHASRK
ncbi:MAG: glycosyltransferase [Betaproteobacteria bacterium]